MLFSMKTAKLDSHILNWKLELFDNHKTELVTSAPDEITRFAVLQGDAFPFFHSRIQVFYLHSYEIKDFPECSIVFYDS